MGLLHLAGLQTPKPRLLSTRRVNAQADHDIRGDHKGAPNHNATPPYGFNTLPTLMHPPPYGFITLPTLMHPPPYGFITLPTLMQPPPYGFITLPTLMQPPPYGVMTLPTLIIMHTPIQATARAEEVSKTLIDEFDIICQDGCLSVSGAGSQG